MAAALAPEIDYELAEAVHDLRVFVKIGPRLDIPDGA
jgi:hypothetical protein